MIKNLTISLLVGAVLASIGYWAIHPTKTIVQKVEPGQNLGSLTGPDIPWSYLNVGGVRTEYRSMALTATSGIPCALQSPAATSSLVNFSFHVTSNPIGLISFDVSTSTTNNAFASSTPAFIINSLIAANGQKDVYWDGAIAASTTNTRLIGFDSFQPAIVTGESAYLIPPSTWLTVKLGTTTPKTLDNYMAGSCSARFAI